MTWGPARTQLGTGNLGTGAFTRTHTSRTPAEALGLRSSLRAAEF